MQKLSIQQDFPQCPIQKKCFSFEGANKYNQNACFCNIYILSVILIVYIILQASSCVRIAVGSWAVTFLIPVQKPVRRVCQPSGHFHYLNPGHESE